MGIDDLVSAVTDWARADGRVSGLVLVGSHARGAAEPDSDVDLVLLSVTPEDLLSDTAWVRSFGQVVSVRREQYGRVTSLRATYSDGAEVEFGVTDLGWASVPLDPGTQRVLADGAVALYDGGGLLAGLLVSAAAVARAERDELELMWDDGSAEGGATGQLASRLAVGFWAPCGARTLTGMRICTMDDGLLNPIDPELPTTEPFTVWVWSPAGGGEPGQAAAPGYMPITGLCEYPEGSWVDIVLPEPVDLFDQDMFPDGRFYLGIEWNYQLNPVIGFDLDPPHDGETRFWDWTSWTVVHTADAMVRAALRDSSPSPIELSSWGSVKSAYR
jgi:hypothetical protein